jgi:hypothetical protein
MSAFLVFLLSLAFQSREQPPSPVADKGDSSPVTVAVLRRDGIVSPFAVFDGKEWTTPWPSDLRSLDLPIGLQAIPAKWWGKRGPLSEMTAWVDGVNRGPIHLMRSTVRPLMCESRVALVSDYQSNDTAPTSPEPPFPKDGLAVSGTQPVGKIDILSRDSPEWAATATFLATEFDNAENAAIEAFTAWKHPVPRAARRKLPAQLEALYRAPMDTAGWMAYYVEAVKRYPPGPEDEDCGLVTSASGWMTVGPDGKRAGKLAALVTYCDRRDVTYMLPLGLLTVAGKTFWAFQLSGYGLEGYGITRPTAKKIESHVKYSAGVCPRRILRPIAQESRPASRRLVPITAPSLAPSPILRGLLN